MGFLLSFFFFATLAAASFVAGQNDAGYNYCLLEDALESYEFQATLAVKNFAAVPTVRKLRIVAQSLFNDFVTASAGLVEGKDSYDESIFRELSWFLTQPDGRPLPEDATTAAQYTESCYVRTREELEYDDDGELDDDFEVSSALKIRGIEPGTFRKPRDVRDDIDCDVYADLKRVTYKAKAKDLTLPPSFNAFWVVLALYPWAGDFFMLKPEVELPERDRYSTHRFRWKKISIEGVEIRCTLDVRFCTYADSLLGRNAYDGEFSCDIDIDEIHESRADPDRILNGMAGVFREFEKTVWVEDAQKSVRKRSI